MLSAEERRRLDEIERLLQLDDPRFVARMRATPRGTRRRVGLVAYGLLWMIALAVGVLVHPVAGLCVAALGAVVGAVLATVAAYRQRRSWRRDEDGWPPMPHH